jgi:hypothetical protein
MFSAPQSRTADSKAVTGVGGKKSRRTLSPVALARRCASRSSVAGTSPWNQRSRSVLLSSATGRTRMASSRCAFALDLSISTQKRWRLRHAVQPVVRKRIIDRIAGGGRKSRSVAPERRNENLRPGEHGDASGGDIIIGNP